RRHCLLLSVDVDIDAVVGGWAHKSNRQAPARDDHRLVRLDIADLNATQVALQNKLSTFEVALERIIPSQNTYKIKPNQSMIVASGRLTIGLVGPPTNDSVNININGKQQAMATGDVIKVTLDPSTTCQVRVQSFDMFKVVLNAS